VRAPALAVVAAVVVVVAVAEVAVRPVICVVPQVAWAALLPMAAAMAAALATVVVAASVAAAAMVAALPPMAVATVAAATAILAVPRVHHLGGKRLCRALLRSASTVGITKLTGDDNISAFPTQHDKDDRQRWLFRSISRYPTNVGASLISTEKQRLVWQWLCPGCFRKNVSCLCMSEEMRRLRFDETE
jgi:hypothetical protein